jgi:hypothetical protein
VVGHRRWAQAAYNLVGFPLLVGSEPAVSLLKSTSAISEVLKLDADGHWQRLADAALLQSGQAYLAYYQETAAEDYTAPLELRDVTSAGLSFQRSAGGVSRSLKIENRAAVPATVLISLLGGATSEVALRYSTGPTQTVDLRTNSPVIVTVGPRNAKSLNFQVAARDQKSAGAGLLQIQSATVGTRWLLPLTTVAGSYAGLWVGDVVVNDVSESRLGATNVANGLLTIALRSRDNSGIRGATELREIIAGWCYRALRRPRRCRR